MVRRRGPASRDLAAGIVVGVVLIGVLASTGVVHAQPTASDGTVAADLDGPCTATATINETGATVDPSASGGVYTAPFEGSASYTGSIAVPAEPRAFSGRVWVETPPGIPSITIKDWSDDDGENVSDSGTVDWSIPQIVPGGVTVTVSGVHNDASATCTGSIKVELEGGFMDSPVGPASVALTVLTGLGLAWAAFPVRGGI
jgi:hypothetical protein